MKKLFTTSLALALTFTFSISTLAAAPVASYSFDGDLDGAVPVERVEYYTNDGIVESNGDSFTYTEGPLNQALKLDGIEALKLPLSMNTESYTVSYWIKPDKISPLTPTFMVTPFGFEADNFINVSLFVGNYSPNLWTHMTEPYDERNEAGAPGLLAVDTWTHITIVVDENMSEDLLFDYKVTLNEYTSGAAIYINGFLVDVSRVPKGLCVDTSEYWFGINIWDDMYTGALDELEFYDTALSADEIKALYLDAGGDPDAESPVISKRPTDSEGSYKPDGGSFSDDYIPQEQGTISGNNNHLNLENAAPITTQGVDTTTNVYADTASIIAFGLLILALGLLLQYIKQKRNSYE